MPACLRANRPFSVPISAAAPGTCCNAWASVNPPGPAVGAASEGSPGIEGGTGGGASAPSPIGSRAGGATFGAGIEAARLGPAGLPNVDASCWTVG